MADSEKQRQHADAGSFISVIRVDCGMAFFYCSPMRGTSLTVTIFIIALNLGVMELRAQFPANLVSSADRFVVLKNGEILRGRVTQNAERVIVLTEQGSRLVLSADQTDFVCKSMDEAYWGKCARAKASDIPAQKRLFFWCVKNKLLDHAQNQIDLLMQSKIKASELEYIDRQLNVAVIQQKLAEDRLVQQTRLRKIKNVETHPVPVERVTQEKRLALAPILMDDTIGDGNLEAASYDTSMIRPLPSLSQASGQAGSQFAGLPPMIDDAAFDGEASKIRQVGFEEAIEFDTISLDDRKLSTSHEIAEPFQLEIVDDREMVSIPELERQTRSMPEGSLGHFRQRVERVLTSGCNAAKCHDSNSRVMPLLHLNRTQAIPRRQSQRNLHNILKYVDRQHPFASPLFIAATTPHAGGGKPILKAGSPHYENLKRWLVMLSDDPGTAALESMNVLTLSGENLSGENAVVAANHDSSHVVPVKPEPVGLKPLDDSSNKFPVIGKIPKLNSQEPGFTPIDPFDPEIFNRNFGGNN